MSRALARLLSAHREGGTIYVAGNGGSAEQANHFVGELVGGMNKLDFMPVKAVSLCSNMALVTALANDFGYREVFFRQLVGVMSSRDVFLGISTSGHSENILLALKYCLPLYNSILLTSPSACTNPLVQRHAGKEIEVVVLDAGSDTQAIQELHMAVLHGWATELEKEKAPIRWGLDGDRGDFLRIF